MSRILFTVLLAGLAVSGAILGYRLLAASGDEPAAPQQPKTATPVPGDEEGYWTPERLKEAKPIEMPYAPEPPSSAEEPDAAQSGPSQSGAGSAGSGDVPPDEGTTLIPGLSKSDPDDDSKQ